MTLKDRLIRYILKRDTTTLMQLEGVVVSAGYTLDELFATLDKVHADKRISYTTNASGEITYRPANAKPKAGSHLAWVNDNYPRYEYDMPFPEIDMSWIVLSPEEMKKYKAEATGRPLFMYNKKNYGQNSRG